MVLTNAGNTIVFQEGGLGHCRPFSFIQSDLTRASEVYQRMSNEATYQRPHGEADTKLGSMICRVTIK